MFDIPEQAGAEGLLNSNLLNFAYSPQPVKFPRKVLNQTFAVLLMRSSYDAVDDLDFIPMNVRAFAALKLNFLSVLCSSHDGQMNLHSHATLARHFKSFSGCSGRVSKKVIICNTHPWSHAWGIWQILCTLISYPLPSMLLLGGRCRKENTYSRSSVMNARAKKGQWSAIKPLQMNSYLPTSMD